MSLQPHLRSAVPASARPPRATFVDGALAGSMSLAILLATQLLLGVGGFLAALADGFTRFVPLDIFETGIQLLGPGAKSLVFAGTCAGVVLAGGLAGGLLSRIRTGEWLFDGLLVAGATLALAELVVLPLFGAGFAGSKLVTDPFALHPPLILASLAYGVALCGLRDSHLPAPVASESSSAASGVRFESLTGELGSSRMPRRTFLGRTLAVIGGISLVVSALAVVRQFTLLPSPVNPGTPVNPGPPASLAPGATPPPVAGDPFGPTPATTPLDDFYVVQKNFISPSVNVASWHLTVDGLVATPKDWSMDELRALPSVTGPWTLSCISNDVEGGGNLIGNQEWQGTLLANVLDAAGVAPNASWILWESADGYTESLPLDVARGLEVWLAYEMGGEPLTDDHGFPVRVLIPGRFGMKQPKWLTRIQLADHDEAGYWEQRTWDENAYALNMSRIDFPNNGATVRAGIPFPVTGIAFAGDRGVAKVEISQDGGGTWLDATLQDATRDPLGEYTWVRWRADVTVPATAAGSTVKLTVRATSEDGTVQDGNSRPTLPSGATGWHAIRVVVTA